MSYISHFFLTLICPNNVTLNNFSQTSGALSILSQTENKRFFAETGE